MADIRHIIFLLTLVINYSFCLYNHAIHKRTEEIKNLSKMMYGEINNAEYNIQNVEDNLWYPRGDKTKLSALSSLWREYYDCSVRSLDRLTRNGQVPSVMVMVYSGAVARLPCSVCAAPSQGGAVEWMFADFSSTNKTLSPMLENERMVIEHDQLSIYNTREEDAGRYRCNIGDSNSLAVLEVVDTEDSYIVTKPRTARGPYAQPPVDLDQVTLFSLWSPWSECSVCGKVGRRHRYGMCYVRLNRATIHTNRKITINTTKVNITDDALVLFEAFPGGIPCRSRFLPSCLKNVDAIQERQSEIMISMCKVPCEEKIFKLRSWNGDVLETANNSAGIYSLQQPLPKQPPVPARDTIFADVQQYVVIRCPGTTLRDVPVLWRCGTKLMAPRDVDKASGGRMYINCRDHLVINKVLYRDANIYSCSQREGVAGSVRLVVRAARPAELGARALALALGAVLLAAANSVVRMRSRARAGTHN